MKKSLIVILMFPVLIFTQEISVYGNRGMFKIQYAQPHNMGMFSYHLSLSERFENLRQPVGADSTTDRRHFLHITTGLSYAIADYVETRFHAAPFVKYYEASDYPVERGDPRAVIGVSTLEIGLKLGYSSIVDEVTPTSYAFGLDGYVDFGPGLATEFFSNARASDSALYRGTFYTDNISPNFPPYIPHDPDFGFTGLFDFKIGPFASHLNVGYLLPGTDKNPGYVDPLDFHQRPNYITHGLGIELIPSDAARILFETYGMYDTDATEESLWVTPGLRFGSTTVSFDLGCELGIVGTWFWKAFLNFSAGTDLVKKPAIPIARVSGRIYDAKTSEPLAAIIMFPDSDKELIQVSDNGLYDVKFTPGSYRIRVDAPEYRWKEHGLILKDGDRIVLDFGLNKKSKIIGKIFDAETKEPILANITFPQTDVEAIASDTSGMYSISLTPGTYRLHVEATGYQFEEQVVTLREDELKVVDIALGKFTKSTLTGKVSEFETGKPILAQVSFVGTNFPPATTDPTTGIYKTNVAPGTYSVMVDAEDYVSESAPVVLAKDETKIQNFTLKPIPKVGEKVILKGIYFDFNSAVIRPESYPVLDDAAKVLKAKPKMRVEIGGHTDSIGSDAYNMKLSSQRANSVREYLIRYHNIEPDRLIGVGYGEAQPIADNRTKTGRDLNRRIEFKVLSW